MSSHDQHDQPETPTPSTQEQSLMTENENPWPDAVPRTDPTAAIDIGDPLGSAGSGEQGPTAALPGTTALPQPALPQTTALPYLPQQSAPYRVDHTTALPGSPVPDDRVPDEEVGAPYGPASGAWPSAPQRPLVTVARGPRPGTVLFGLVCILVAAYGLVVNLAGTAPDLTLHLPAVVGAAGGLLLLVGLGGLVLGRRRRR